MPPCVLRDARCDAGGTMPPLRKRPVQQRLKEMLRLPFRFPVLCAQTLELLDDARGEPLDHETRETSESRESKPRAFRVSR